MSNPGDHVQSSTPESGFAPGTNVLFRALGDLHQRRVFRTAVSYTLAAWFILQIADVVFPLLEVPGSALKMVAVGEVLGFPVAVVVAWLYQITPNGIVMHRPSRPGALEATRADWIVNSSLLAISSAFAVLLLLGLAARGGGQAPRIAIKVTEVARLADGDPPLAPGLEQELRNQLVQTTNLQPMSAQDAADLREPVNLVLWVDVHAEEGSVRVRALLQSLDGEGSYPYFGAFDLPIGPSTEVERKAAVRIAGEVRRALLRAGSKG